MAHRPIALTRPRPRSQLRVPRTPHQQVVVTLMCWILGLLQSVAAQGAGDPDYAAAAAIARAALGTAQVSGETPHPDRPVWQAAFRAGEAALALVREDVGSDELTDALRFNARVYAVVGWYSRAFEAFDALLVSGGELSTEPVPSAVAGVFVPSDAELFVTATNQLGFARYQAGDDEDAQAYYLTVLEMFPDEPEALRWLGRIAFEQGDAASASVASAYFGRLAELYPDDEGAVYYARLSRDRVAYGVPASDSFQRGLQLYEAGNLEDALVEFRSALVENPAYVDAEVWVGRIELESARPDRAVAHWQNVVAARPDDEGASWFLGFAQTLARWGVEAGELYYRGLSSYEAGDLESATVAFQAAAAANDTFVEAHVWAARTLQESDAPLEAIPYWERVLVLDPDDDRAAWYLTRARQALEFGPVAGPAYYDALAYYQAGDQGEAERLLRVAVDANPGFAQAWGYLGRIAFQDGRYEEADEAYTRAAVAAPEVDDYAFFANEARALLEAEQPGEEEGIEPLPPEGDDEEGR